MRFRGGADWFRHFVFLALIFSGLLLTGTPQARPQSFQAASSIKEKQQISFIEQNFSPSLPLKLYAVDLNNDFIDEYIIRSGNCAGQYRLCHHFITAFKDSTPFLLGRINAHRIEVIRDKSDYGVHALLAYTDPGNDFQAEEWRWKPKNFEFSK